MLKLSNIQINEIPESCRISFQGWVKRENLPKKIVDKLVVENVNIQKKQPESHIIVESNCECHPERYPNLIMYKFGVEKPYDDDNEEYFRQYSVHCHDSCKKFHGGCTIGKKLIKSHHEKLRKMTIGHKIVQKMEF